MGDFLRHYEERAPQIHRLLCTIRIFLAPCEAVRRVRERIEAAVASAVRSLSEEARAFFDDTVIYRPRRSGEPPLLLRCEASAHMLALPRHLAA